MKLLPVTDTAILELLEGPSRSAPTPKGLRPVEDPSLLETLESGGPAGPTPLGRKTYDPVAMQKTVERKRKTVNGREYYEHITGTLYDATTNRPTDDPAVMEAFGKKKLSKKAQDALAFQDFREQAGKPPEPGITDYAFEGAKGVIPGLAQVATGTMRGVSTWTSDVASRVKEVEDGIANLRNMDVDSANAFLQSIAQKGGLNPVVAMNYQMAARALWKGEDAKAAEYLATARKYADTRDLKDQRLVQQADAIDKSVGETFAAAPGWKDSFTRQVGQGLGNAAGFVGLGLIPGAGTAAITTGGGLMATDQSQQQAEADIANSRRDDRAGPTGWLDKDFAKTRALEAGKLGTAAGATETIPVEMLLNQVAARIPGLRPIANTKIWSNFVRGVERIAVQAAAEGGQEYGQTVMQNVINKMMANPDQQWDEGALQAALVGAAVGGGIQAGVEGTRARFAKTDAQGGEPKPPGPDDRVEPTLGPQTVNREAKADRQEPLLIDDRRLRPQAAPEAVLRGAGYSDEQVSDMNPAERAQAAREAQEQGVAPVAPEPGKARLAPRLRPVADPNIIKRLEAPTGTRQLPAPIASEADLAPVREIVDTEPTESQAAAGNYQKGHVKLGGMDIAIENPKGSVRRGKDPDGTPWQTQMAADYGYVKGSVGKDGDQIDVFLGPDHTSQKVYVIDQIDLKTGRFDEHKTVTSVNSEQEARDLYARSFSDGKGEDRIGAITEMPVDRFRKWATNGKKRGPLGTIVAPAIEITPDQAKAFTGLYSSRQPITVETVASALGVDARTAGRIIGEKVKQGSVLHVRTFGKNSKGKKIVTGSRYMRAPTRVKPVSFLEWIASQGGIKDDGGELAARDVTSRTMTPYGPVVRPRGLSFDDLLIRAVQDGYIEDVSRATGGQSELTIDTLLDKIDQERSGRKQYAADDQGRAADLAAEQANKELMSRDGFPLEAAPNPLVAEFGEDAYAALMSTISEAGGNYSTFTGAEKTRAARMIAGGMDPADALERVSIENDAELLEDMQADLMGGKWPNPRRASADLASLYDPPPFFVIDALQPQEPTPDAVDEGTASRQGEDLPINGAERAAGGIEGIPRQAGGEVQGVGEDQSAAGPGQEPATEAEVGADNKPQLTIPGTARIGQGEQAQREADKPLKPKVAQKGLQVGLFGDEKNQQDLFGQDDEQEVSPPSNYQPLHQFVSPTDGALGLAARDYVLRQGAESNAEIMLAFDANGRVLSDGRGPSGGKTVGISSEQARAQNDPMQQVVVHHNHPLEGSSLSVIDIAMLAFPGNRVVWAHTKTNSYRATLNETLRGIPTGRLFGIITKNANRWLVPVYDLLQSRVLVGAITAEEAQRQFTHWRNTALHNAGAIHYFTAITTHPDGEMRVAILQAAKAIKKGFADENINVGGRARPVRYAGDLGILPEGIGNDTGGRPQAGADKRDRRSDRGPQGGPETGFEQDNRLRATGVRQDRLAAVARPQETFYSGLLRAVEGLKQEKAPAAQWLGTIRNQPGVKPEEISWLGLEDWLREQTGTVTRSQIADFIRTNQVQVKDVVKGGEVASKFSSPSEAIQWLKDNGISKDPEEDWGYSDPRDYITLAQSYISKQNSAEPKFSEYQLPGGENYRELLLTLPSMKEALLPHERGSMVNVARNEALDFRSSHFTERNVLAHVRFNERTDADGRKVLFIEEIQSDWHQSGRKKGYNQAALSKEDLDQLVEERRKLLRKVDPRSAVYNELRADQIDDIQTRIQEIGDIIAESNSTVPDAPFKTTWPELALKRMIRWAAEKGFDAVSWTPGDVQANRYDLSKHVSRITFNHEPTDKVPGKVYMAVSQNENAEPVLKGMFTQNEVADHVGKDIADKIFADPENRNYDTLTGLDLKVGGEGMRAFYDKILVDAANKLGKKFGARVYRAKIPTVVDGWGIADQSGEFTDDRHWNNADDVRKVMRQAGMRESDGLFSPKLDPEGSPISAHSLPITPAMRDSVMQGQPLFKASASQEFPPFWSSISDTQRREIRARVEALGERILGRRIRVGVVDRIRDDEGHPTTLQGIFDPNDRTVTIAAQAAFSDVETAGHEFIHALRDLGVVTVPEWALLKREAQPFLAEAKAVYEEGYRARMDVTEDQLQDIIAEEAVARMFGSYLKDRESGQMPPRARTIMDRVKQFLGALRNLFRGYGFRTGQGTMEDIAAGDMAGRQETEGPGRGYYLMSKDPSAPMFTGNEQQPLASTGWVPPPRRPAAGTFEAPHDERTLDALWDSTDTLLNRIRRAGHAFGIAARRKLQDREVDVIRTQRAIEDAGGTIPETQDVYLAASLYPGRVAAHDRNLMERVIKPLIEDIHRRGLNLEDVDKFVQARHAIERNQAMGQMRPPGHPFREALTNPDVVGGSGYSAREVAQIMATVRQSGKMADYTAIGDAVVDLNRRTLTGKLREGLISQETFDDLTAKYRYYVPLRGYDDPDSNDHPDSPRTGRRYDTRGRDVKQAFGRMSKADSSVAYTIMQAREALIRIEKNRVGKTLLRLAQSYPNEAFWQINRIDLRNTIDKNTGMVRRIYDRGTQAAENDFAVKIGGKTYHITLHHEGLLNAMKGIGGANMGPLLQGFHRINRFLASLNTSWDPEFIFRNFMRDLQQTGIVLQEKDTKGIARQVLKSLPHAMRGMNRMLRNDLSTPWANAAQEFANAGGKMGFMGLGDIETEKNTLERLMAELSPSMGRKSWMLVRDHLFGRLDRWNDSIENTMRLAVYKALRDRGNSQAKAAYAARELTVNFNRKGEWGPAVNAFYMFFNASMQGATNMAIRMARSPRLRKVLLGITLVALAQDILNRMIGGDDEDGENRYDKIPGFVKQKYGIIMMPKWAEDQYGLPYLRWPLPLGYNIFHVIGTQIGHVIAGGRPVMDASGTIVTTIADAFNPLGGGNWWNTIAPTLLDPAFDIQANKNYFGEDILPRSFDDTTPDAQRYKSNVTPAAKSLTDALSRWTGGSPERAGKIDVSPESIEHFWEFATGGLGRLVSRSMSTWGTLRSGEDWDASKTPFLRIFTGQTSKYQDRNVYYDIRDALHVTEKELKAREAEGDDAAVARIQAERERELMMIPMLKQAEKHRARLSDAYKAAQRRQDIGDAERRRILRDISGQMDAIMLDTRKEWNKLGKTLNAQ